MNEFTLTREPAERPKLERFENVKTTQRKLLTGLDCLPGQQDLFQVDGERQEEVRLENPR